MLIDFVFQSALAFGSCLASLSRGKGTGLADKGQRHFLAERAADEPAHAMGLPLGFLHNLGQRRAAFTFE